MTILVACAVRDRQIGFNRPFFVPTNGVAVRGFTDEVNSKESSMNSHPEDYELFRIGTFDDEQGVMVSEAHVSLCVASNVHVKG